MLIYQMSFIRGISGFFPTYGAKTLIVKTVVTEECCSFWSVVLFKLAYEKYFFVFRTTVTHIYLADFYS